MPRKDPWRYVSPCCGRSDWHVARSWYYCNHCKERFERLYDKKTGEPAKRRKTTP